MPTRTFQEIITKSIDECDWCGKQAGNNGTHRCAICDRFACVNCGYSDHWEHLIGEARTWLCYDCGSIGERCKDVIRKARKEIMEARKLWHKLGKENANASCHR